MKFYHFASLAFSVAAQVENVLNTVPVAREGYHPLSSVQTSFQLEKPDSLIVAGMEITPNFPTVNLANFPNIEIACLEGSIDLLFPDTSSANQALGSWKDTDNLHFMINHEVKCHGIDGTTAYKVNDLTLNDSKISFSYSAVEIKDIVKEYKLDIAHLPAANQDGKRGLHSEVVPLGVNYANGQVTNPSINIYSNPAGDISCQNCYANGNANIQLSVSGIGIKLNDYKLLLNGNLFANMDLDAKIHAADPNFVKQVNLFTKSLAPITVKRLFNFGPAIALDAGVSYSITEDIDFTFGFEFNYDFAFTAMAHQKPTFSQTPVLKEHPLTVSKDIQVSVAAHIIPIVEMNLEVLGHFTFDTALPIDTSLGVELDSGKFSSCPNGDLGVSLFAQTDMSFKAHGESSIRLFKPFDETYDIFNTGKVALKTFCQKPKTNTFTTTIQIGPLPTLNPLPSLVPETTTTQPVAETTTAAFTTSIASSTLIASSTSTSSVVKKPKKTHTSTAFSTAQSTTAVQSATTAPSLSSLTANPLLTTTAAVQTLPTTITISSVPSAASSAVPLSSNIIETGYPTNTLEASTTEAAPTLSIPCVTDFSTAVAPKETTSVNPQISNKPKYVPETVSSPNTSNQSGNYPVDKSNSNSKSGYGSQSGSSNNDIAKPNPGNQNILSGASSSSFTLALIAVFIF
ncbi:hypothetical protein HDV06_001262 [Boothiomyces sp. JEL0866]|nr:hypothetical protein HDV06_001262 [Boothiomyces sp. JEL0866]